ncbi:MAG: site-specific integrase [Chloroflexota bacterium]|nr:site-specific integrase [Chloroflexota bacterium]
MRGSIQKYVGQRGTAWYAVVDLPPDPATGKRRQKRVSAPTKRECETLVTQVIAAAERGGTTVDGKETVRHYLARWLAAVEPTLKPATFRRYGDMVRLHIVPVAGDVRLTKLSPLDVQRLYADRLVSGLSPTTVSNLHAMLHRALEQAVRWGLLARNVTEMVDPPRRATPETATWDTRQVAAVLATADRDDDGCGALWRLALLTGMRRGEILGLMWQDVDLDRGMLSVRRTLSRGKGGTWEFGTPKTTAGRRSIALPPSVVESLKRHRIQQVEHRLALGPLWEDRGFVFTNETGGPLHVNALAGRFRHLVASAEVPRIRFHDLRHTSATLMLANGEHPKIVQERLGHADIAMTMRYSHVTMGMQRDAADRLDAALRKAGDQPSEAAS